MMNIDIWPGVTNLKKYFLSVGFLVIFCPLSMMNLNLIVLVIFLLGMISCKQQPENNSESSSQDAIGMEHSADIPVITCYEKISNQDTFRLRVEFFEGKVTGTLAYLFHEKDSNIGEYEGRMHGDTLVADYIFTSEGSTSVRQVAFRIDNQTAQEGYGDMKNVDGKMTFSDWKTLTYGQGVILSIKECPE